MFDAIRQQLAQDGTATFAVRARPGASRSKVTGILADGSIKIDIAATPDGGEANEALVRFIAKELGTAPQSVEILSGKTGRRKIVRIQKP